jgi:DNA helicase-2/ATP-dependent DNA helicase PcrA
MAEGLPSDSARQVLFLSFSNAAIRRLATAAGIQFPREQKRKLRFLTFHALAAELLRFYGRFIDLPPKIRIADNLEERLIAIEANWQDDESDPAARLVALAKTEGILCFKSLIPLATKLLETSPELRKIISRRFPLIIVDEFQDTSEEQWKLLQLLGGASQVLAFGDPNQIIYSSLHAATERRMADFCTWKGVSPMALTLNHRCSNQEILTFATSLLNATPFTASAASDVRIFDVQYRTRLRVFLATVWKAVQDQIGPGQTIGFLAPTNVLVEDTAVALRNPPPSSVMQLPVYAQMARDEAAHDAVLLALAALRDMALNPSAMTLKKSALAMLAMNLSWNSRLKLKSGDIEKQAQKFEKLAADGTSAFKLFLDNLRSARELNSKVIAFSAALEASGLTEYKVTMKRVLSHARLTTNRVTAEQPELLLFDNLRAGRTAKGLQGDDAWEGRTHILTYHKAKGREFDFVVMIVDPRGESSSAALSEKQRQYHSRAVNRRQAFLIS